MRSVVLLLAAVAPPKNVALCMRCSAAPPSSPTRRPKSGTKRRCRVTSRAPAMLQRGGWSLDVERKGQGRDSDVASIAPTAVIVSGARGFCAFEIFTTFAVRLSTWPRRAPSPDRPRAERGCCAAASRLIQRSRNGAGAGASASSRKAQTSLCSATRERPLCTPAREARRSPRRLHPTNVTCWLKHRRGISSHARARVR